MVIILERIFKMCAALPGQLYDFKICPVLHNAGFMCKTKQGEFNCKHVTKQIRGSIESGFLLSLHSRRQETPFCIMQMPSDHGIAETA